MRSYKETTIVFLYDLNNYKSETENGSSPVLYFHPKNVSHIQKNLLCGHICATADTFHGFLGPTKIIALENGKFVLQKFGNFHLGVGSDINLPNWMLERRIEMLSNWIQLYHNDFETIEKKSTSRKNFLDRLRVIFESLIKFLPNRFAMFENSLHFLLPKSTSLIFLEAVQLLQFFKTFPLVVGGTILFENRIIATQFEPNLIRSFIQSDPYRVPTSAERVIESNDYQLLVIYVNKSSYENLRKCSDNNIEIKSVSKEKSINSNEKVLIRDRSSIFSTVIEEDSDRVTEKKPARRPQTLNLATRTTDIDYDTNMKELKIMTPFARESVTNTPTTTLVEVAKTKTIYDSSVVICEQKKQRSIDFDDLLAMEIETSLAGCNIVEPPPNRMRKWSSCNDLIREICSFSNINRRCYTISDIKLTISPTPVHLDIETIVKDITVSQSCDKSRMNCNDSDASDDTPLSPLMESLTGYSVSDKHALNQKPTIKMTPKTETLPNTGLSELRKAYLFIYGLKDLALYLILECDNDVNPLCSIFLDSLVRNCRGEFSTFESALRHYLELFDVQQNCTKDDYNFISIDSKWGPTKKINSLSNDLDENRSLALINQSFFNNNDLSEITLGTERGVAYGHRLANTTTLYWQQTNCITTAGIPRPTDLFGTINTAAKKRLYNDHSINLL